MEVVTAAPSGPALSAADKRALVDRIVATPAFSKSERLISFLLHVCQMEAAGLASSLSEQRIGESVFGRSKDYDPSIDGIVRSHASRLRTRLDQYFETDGIHEPVRMSIPRGGYVPVYEPRLPVPQQRLQPAVVVHEPNPGAVPLLPVAAHPSAHRPSRWWLWATLIALALLLSMLIKVNALSRIEVLLGARSPSDELWNSLFLPGRETTLVVGDGGVNMLANMAHRQITAEEYSSRSWLNNPLAQTPPGSSWAPIAARSYTPWFIVGFAMRLARLPAVHDNQLKSISARELSLNALKNDQLVIVGGPEYDPWEQLLWNKHNFHVVYDGLENSISIINKQPGPGELPVYKWSQTDTVSHAGYSLICYEKNLNGNGHILELEGSTAQGDEAATDFVLDPTRFDPFLRMALNKDGRLAEFELVLRTSFVAGGNMDSRIVAFRIHR
jgi:hypothetical protein